MITKLFSVLLLLASSSLLPSLSEGAAIPKIARPVNDYANIITTAQENRIADLLIAHRKKTGVQIAVLTVRTTGKMSIEEYSLKTAEKWGGGSKERDDGLLFTVAVADRRMRIEVGYGLEGYITDLRAGRIIDGIRDDFRKNRYGRGIEKVVREIILHTESLRAGEEVPASARLRGAFFHVFKFPITGFILGVVIAACFMILKRMMKFHILITIVVSLIVFAFIPVLLQMYVPGVWYWMPVVYITGALAGASVAAAFGVKLKRMIGFAIFLNSVPAVIGLSFIIYCLHVLKPLQDSTTGHETLLLIVLFYCNCLQFVFLLLTVFDVFSDTSGTYDSNGLFSYSGSSSYTSSNSSNSNDTSWSGGGGSYGGGGASSSW